jgi:hypothetical protein
LSLHLEDFETQQNLEREEVREESGAEIWVEVQKSIAVACILSC